MIVLPLAPEWGCGHRPSILAQIMNMVDVLYYSSVFLLGNFHKNIPHESMEEVNKFLLISSCINKLSECYNILGSLQDDSVEDSISFLKLNNKEARLL